VSARAGYFSSCSFYECIHGKLLFSNVYNCTTISLPSHYILFLYRTPSTSIFLPFPSLSLSSPSIHCGVAESCELAQRGLSTTITVDDLTHVKQQKFIVFTARPHCSQCGRAVLARGILSVRPSVCPSVTFRYCVQKNENTIVQFAASGSTILLVSGEVKFIRSIFAGDHPSGGVKVRHPSIERENSTNNRP